MISPGCPGIHFNHHRTGPQLGKKNYRQETSGVVGKNRSSQMLQISQEPEQGYRERSGEKEDWMEQVYYDKGKRKLFWNPEHTWVVAKVAQELYDENPRKYGFDRSIREGKGDKEPNRFLSWACLGDKHLALLNHPKIKELNDMKTIEAPEQFLKDLYGCSGMPDVKKTLEKHFAAVVKPEQFSYKRGEIFLGSYCNPYMCKSEADGLIQLSSGCHHNLYDDDQNNKLWKPMNKGTITITVMNGKATGATVQEN